MATLSTDPTSFPLPPSTDLFLSSSGIITEDPFGNLPALTTFFSPDSGCTTDWVLYPITLEGYPTITPARSDFGFDARLCNPLGVFATRGYSPGVCELGQTIASLGVSQYGLGQSSEISSAIITLWSGMCCKENFYYDSGGCMSNFDTPTTVHAPVETTDSLGQTTISISMTDSSGSFAACNFGGASHICSETVLTSGAAQVEPLIVYWQSKDLVEFPELYASSLASQMGVSFTVSSSSTLSGTDPPLSNASSNSENLAPGSIVAIVLGTVLGALLIGAGILFFLRRRRRRRLAQLQSLENPVATSQQTQSQNPIAVTQQVYSQEMQGAAEAGELDPRGTWVEIGSGHFVEAGDQSPVEVEAGDVHESRASFHERS